MADLRRDTSYADGALPAAYQLLSGPAFTGSGGAAVSADNSLQTLYAINVLSTQWPVVMQIDGYVDGSPSNWAAGVGVQSDGTRFEFDLNGASGTGVFYYVNGTSYSQIGAAITGLATSTSKAQRVKLSWAADGTLTAEAFQASTLAELGTELSRVLTPTTRVDTRITTHGKASFLSRNAHLLGLAYTDASISTSGVLSGSAAVAELVASGALATLLPGSIITLPFSRNPGNGARPTGLLNNALAVLTDDANLARLAGASGLTMDGSGRLALANAIPVAPGTSVVVVTREADGKLGVERYTVS